MEPGSAHGKGETSSLMDGVELTEFIALVVRRDRPSKQLPSLALGLQRGPSTPVQLHIASRIVERIVL